MREVTGREIGIEGRRRSSEQGRRGRRRRAEAPGGDASEYKRQGLTQRAEAATRVEEVVAVGRVKWGELRLG